MPFIDDIRRAVRADMASGEKLESLVNIPPTQWLRSDTFP